MSDTPPVIMLCLVELPRPLLRGQPGEPAVALVHRAITRWPFLPVTHCLIEDIPILTLLTPAVAAVTVPDPAPATKPLTKGQQLWRERKQRKALAERHRQHWIDKDDAKKKKTPPSRE